MMKTAISVPDSTAARVDQSAARHGMTRSEFYRTAAERYADELDQEDITRRIDAALADAGQPSESTAAFREAAARIATEDAW
jgi:metal-responsive CopG/Arc/MetJ family transcriptional regulator